MEFFTWHDIEIRIQSYQKNWPESWENVFVYPDEIVIKEISNNRKIEENNNFFKKYFLRLFNKEKQTVQVQFTGEELPISYEEADEEDAYLNIQAPLFKDIYYSNKKDVELKKLEGVPLYAFHSYKGGVGRTLSLIAMIREIISLYKDEKKVLIIDSDLEAPGLTWMTNEINSQSPSISYLDILSLIHANEVSDKLIEKISELAFEQTINIESDEYKGEHFFIPAYRYEGQISDSYSKPENVLLAKENKYLLAEVMSLLGKKLGVQLVAIDLRAGITEVSAPYIFDTRVKKFFVTSTSLQSIQGTNMILKEVFDKTKSDLVSSKILLTMITNEINKSPDTKSQIIEKIVAGVESRIDTDKETFLREDYILEIPFASELVTLGNINQICNTLRGSEVSKQIKNLVDSIFGEDKDSLNEKQIRDGLKRLYEITNQEVTAEGTVTANMLATSSIQEIIRNHRINIPKMVVLGAKGSGKTYIYKQLTNAKTWNRFVELIDGKPLLGDDILIFPLLASENRSNLNTLFRECLDNINNSIDEINIDTKIISQNNRTIKQKKEENLTESQWMEEWINLILDSMNISCKTLEELDKFLKNKRKKIVFIVDGLEDCFDMMSYNKNWKKGVQALCQDLINYLNDLTYGNIGVISFIRKDMAEDSIDTNYEQFKSQYSKYSLNWSQSEALRLALWMTVKAQMNIASEEEVLNLTRLTMEERLELLWGKKLGRKDSKEAYSARWILAALSDFNGQLQARDIVRFLKYAAQNFQDVKISYNDRYLMPSEIRNAIEPCSKAKYEEIKAEIKSISHVLEKIETENADSKVLPMRLDKLSLTGEEINRLESQGYLKILDKKYYLPEIIRQALGFKYEKGARPKVLSLLVKN